MKLYVPHLEKHSGEFIPYARQLPLATLDLLVPGNAGACIAVNLQAAYVAGQVLVRGHWHVELAGDCSRCLMETIYHVEEHFSEEFRLLKGSSYEARERVAADTGDILFYTGDLLDLKEYLRQSFLVCQPLKILCNENCKGLCPVCGVDRNNSECGCRQETFDPRLRSLMAFKQK